MQDKAKTSDIEQDVVLDRGAINDNQLGELFDPKAEFDISEGVRPHWTQAGAIVFVNFRTRDSVPREVVLRWEREKNGWLKE